MSQYDQICPDVVVARNHIINFKLQTSSNWYGWILLLIDTHAVGWHYPHAQWRPTDAKDTAPGRNGTPGEMGTWQNLKSNPDPQAHKLTESHPVPVGGSSGIGAHIRFGGNPNWTMHPCAAK